MIRHNSSNINPSIVNSPTIAERLTAAEGIRTDKPITGLNHVVNSVNFELSNDNTYILRKPLIHRTSVGWLNILIYNKDYELVCESDIDIRLVNRESKVEIPNQDVKLYFKATALDGTVYTESLEAGNHILGDVFTLHKDDVKVANTNSNTVFFNVQVDLDELERESNLTFYELDVMSQNDARAVKRILILYEAEDRNWYLEMINPEMNTLTGDAESATNFNPNLTLDNPYALRDLYKCGGNSVTQILPYTSKNTNSVTSDFVLETSGHVNIPLEQGVFEVQYSDDSKVISIYTKVHLLAFNPNDTNTSSSEYYNALNSEDTIEVLINGSWNVSESESMTLSVTTWKFRHYIPAGTLICKLDMPNKNYENLITNITLKGPNPYLYIIDANVAFENFKTAKFFKYSYKTYKLTHSRTDGVICSDNSLRYGLDLVFDTDKFILLKDKNHTTPLYITLSKSELSVDEAKSKLIHFSDANDSINLTEPLSLHMYLWKLSHTSNLPSSLAISTLTESVKPEYVLAESFNKDNINAVLLKAFVTTQTTSDNYYCMWEVSKDGGETWDIAPEFVHKFKNHLINIPVLDPTHSEESLEEAYNYIKYYEMAPFNLIKQNTDLVSDRPDVLEISGDLIQYQYRFSIYKYKYLDTTSSEFTICHALKQPVFRIGNSYIMSSNQHPSVDMAILGVAQDRATQTYVYVKYPSKYKNCTVKYFCSANINDNPSHSEYVSVSNSPITSVEDGITYNYVKLDLKLNNAATACWYYKIIVVDELRNIISRSLNNVVYYQGNVSKFIDLDETELTSTGVDVYTYIPSIICKVDTETCTLDYVTSDGTSVTIDIAGVGSGTANTTLQKDTLQITNYYVKGTLYNNSNFEQELSISQIVHDQVKRQYMKALSPDSSECTLKIGSKVIDVEYIDSARPESTLTTEHNFITIPARKSIDFELSSTIKFLPKSDSVLLRILAFRAVTPLAFQYLGNTLTVASTANLNWIVYAPSVQTHINTSAHYSPDLIKDSTFLDDDVNWDLQINVFTEDFKFNNAILTSQKSYVFTITDGETVKLIPKNYGVLTGIPLYYNNQLITYTGNKIYVSDTDSFIFPMFNTIDLTYGYDVTKIIPWRNYLVIFTEYDIYLASYDTELGMYSSKLVNTTLGIPERDAETVVNVLNSIIFKSHNKVYKLVPNMYAATDSVMNTVCISIPIENYLDDSNFNNFAFSTNDNYYLFIPNTTYTMCYVYNYVKNAWTIHKYPVRLTSYDYINSTDIRVYSETKQFYFNKDLNEIFELEHPVPYGDYLYINYDENTDSLDLDCETDVTPIEFSIDFGQKASKYADEKQFIETRINLETLSEKDMFPFNVTITTDGMPRSISTDVTTDSALWKTSLSHVGTLSTQFVNNDSESTGTLRQIMLKYSGRGKTIQHIIRGNSKFKFKFYSLDYKYRNLPNK